MSETVQLRNGGEALDTTVAAIMLNLRLCMEQQPIAFYELASICRDPGHQLFGAVGSTLSERGLLESNGQPHGVVRDVVLSAVTGEGFELTLGDPLAERLPS